MLVALAPELPNNHASLATFTVSAPDGVSDTAPPAGVGSTIATRRLANIQRCAALAGA